MNHQRVPRIENMALLIDPPLWPAHGTLWSHLISDTSIDELQEFASEVALPPQSFDLDHFDIPASRHEEIVAAGATEVTANELTRRLIASGLRVKARDR